MLNKFNGETINPFYFQIKEWLLAFTKSNLSNLLCSEDFRHKDSNEWFQDVYDEKN